MSEYLPVEVIVQILKRLPVKSVVKCRSVCKTWNRLINNPSFISSHLQIALTQPGTPLLLLTLSRDDEDKYILHFDNDDFDEFKQLLFPFKSDLHSIVDSSNGVFCLAYEYSRHDYGKFILWNPSIQKYMTPPELRIANHDDYIKRCGYGYCKRCGFGFDSRVNDYRILKLVVVLQKGKKMTEAYLFSLNGNSWKKVNAIPPNYGMEGQYSLAFVNGAFHWLGYERGKDKKFSKMVLVGLDISTEEFFVMSLPESLLFGGSEMRLMKYEEFSIAVFKRDWDGEIEVWVMQEYGVVGSWTKVLHLTDIIGKFPILLGFRKNGEVLWETGQGQLASMDLKCQQLEDLGISTEAGFEVFDRYVESLVLLDKGVDAGGVNYAHNFNDGSDSDVSTSSEEESEMTQDWNTTEISSLQAELADCFCFMSSFVQVKTAVL